MNKKTVELAERVAELARMGRKVNGMEQELTKANAAFVQLTSNSNGLILDPLHHINEENIVILYQFRFLSSSDKTTFITNQMQQISDLKGQIQSMFTPYNYTFNSKFNIKNSILLFRYK